MSRQEADSNYSKICFEIAKQEHAKQKEIMDMLKSDYSQEEYNAILIGVSYFRMQLYPELKETMMQAICEELYAEFNKK